MTGAAFWIAVKSGIQHDYGSVAIGICGGLFFGLGCAMYTWAVLQRPIRQAAPVSAVFSVTDDDALTNEFDDTSPETRMMLFVMQFVMKWLPESNGELALDTEVDPVSAVSFAKDILEEEGRLYTTEEVSGGWQLGGAIGAGWHNATSAHVTISISSVEGESRHTHVTVRGTSPDYLIRQHAGEKAAQRITQQLAAQFSKAS